MDIFQKERHFGKLAHLWIMKTILESKGIFGKLRPFLLKITIYLLSRKKNPTWKFGTFGDNLESENIYGNTRTFGHFWKSNFTYRKCQKSEDQFGGGRVFGDTRTICKKSGHLIFLEIKDIKWKEEKIFRS